MSETALDKETGLPPLPHGQWWEVRRFQYEHYSPFGASFSIPDGYEVCVVTKWVTPERMVAGDRWWKPSMLMPEKVENKVLFRKQITDPEKFNAWRSQYAGSLPTRVGKDIIEPADVLKVALDILDNIAASKEGADRKKASDALLGAYPPKSLSA